MSTSSFEESKQNRQIKQLNDIIQDQDLLQQFQKKQIAELLTEINSIRESLVQKRSEYQILRSGPNSTDGVQQQNTNQKIFQLKSQNDDIMKSYIQLKQSCEVKLKEIASQIQTDSAQLKEQNGILCDQNEQLAVYSQTWEMLEENEESERQSSLSQSTLKRSNSINTNDLDLFTLGLQQTALKQLKQQNQELIHNLELLSDVEKANLEIDLLAQTQQQDDNDNTRQIQIQSVKKSKQIADSQEEEKERNIQNKHQSNLLQQEIELMLGHMNEGQQSSDQQMKQWQDDIEYFVDYRRNLTEKEILSHHTWLQQVLLIFETQRAARLKLAIPKNIIKNNIPCEFRCLIWTKAFFIQYFTLFLIGNAQKISKNYFNVISDRLKQNPSIVPKKVSKMIFVDVDRTFSQFHNLSFKNQQQKILRNKNNDNLQNENDEEPQNSDLSLYINALREVLKLFYVFRPDISYIQGMSYLAAVLLLNSQNDIYKTFKMFVNVLMKFKILMANYQFQITKIQRQFYAFDVMLKQYQIKSYQHLKQLEINSEVFLIEWFYTLYARIFPLQIVNKIWDLIFNYGDIAIYRIGLAIFNQIENQVIKLNYEDTFFYIRNFATQNFNFKSLFAQIQRYSNFITEEYLYSIYAKHRLDQPSHIVYM